MVFFAVNVRISSYILSCFTFSSSRNMQQLGCMGFFYGSSVSSKQDNTDFYHLSLWYRGMWWLYTYIIGMVFAFNVKALMVIPLVCLVFDLEIISFYTGDLFLEAWTQINWDFTVENVSKITLICSQLAEIILKALDCLMFCFFILLNWVMDVIISGQANHFPIDVNSCDICCMTGHLEH